MPVQLSAAERRALKARAHALNPVVLIGDGGLTAAVIEEIDRSLNAHELIKIRVAGGDRQAREEILLRVCRELDASPVQQIGKILVVYRKQLEVPSRPTAKPKRKPARPLKRSFQNRA